MIKMLNFRQHFGIYSMQIIKKKPDHGECCCCSKCGYIYEECHCQENALVDMATEYEKLQKQYTDLYEKHNKPIEPRATTTQEQQISVFDAKKKIYVNVGLLKDRTFYKNVQKSKHWMRMFNGYGIQREALDQIKTSCDTIVITDENESRSVSFADWIQHNTFRDYGHGVQYFYPFHLMCVI